MEHKKHTFFGKLFESIGSGIKNLFNAKTGADLTDAQIAANQFNAEQAQVDRDFQERMSSTAYQRGVADMRAAGLNPALMYGSGAAASAPAGVSASSVSPGSPSVATMSDMLGGVLPAILGFKQLKQSKGIADEQLRIADDKNRIEEKKVDNEGKKIDSENEERSLNIAFLRATYEARVEGAELQNEVLRGNIKVSDSTCEKLAQEVRNLAEAEKTEPVKRLALRVSSALDAARASEIAALVPYRQAFMSAQTESAKAAAALSFVSAARAQNLIDAGEVDFIIDNMKFSAESAADKAALDSIRADMRSGKAIQYTSGVGKVLQFIPNAIIGGISNLADLVGSSFGSILQGPK